MKLSTAKYILNVTFMAIAAALVLTTFLNSSGLVYVMMVFFCIYAIVFLGFWRCPECKKHLGKLNARKCRHCGKNLYEQ